MPAQRRREVDAAALLAAFALVLGVATRLTHGYEWDELQVLHGAWRIAGGDVPYRDFFEHHPPLLHLLLAPLVRSETDISWRLLIETRLVAAAIVTGVLVTFASLLRRSAGRPAATWGPVAMLVLCPVSGKLFEVRADWFALLVLLGAMLLRSVGRRPRDAVLAGILSGVAVCFTQKAVPLVLGVATWAAVSPRARRLGPYIAGILIPPSALIVAFASVGALGPL